jgi:putative transposase
MRRLREHVKSDERVLGDSDFVQSVLSAQDEQLEARYRLHSQGYDFRRLFLLIGAHFK